MEVLSLKKELKKSINMMYTNVTNCMHKVGDYDIPQVLCPKISNIDFLALYDEHYLYNKTNNTAVCFFLYDKEFDGIYGLWNAIYYDNQKLLNKYKEKFKDVKYIISPDYSHTEDMEKFENYYRFAKMRVVSGWITLELNKIVIPLITYACREDFPLMLQGLEEVETICVSTKGSSAKKRERKMLIDAVKYAVDNLRNLKIIIVYSVSKDENIEDIFSYAKSKDIEIVIPQNTLREINLNNKEVFCGKV